MTKSSNFQLPTSNFASLLQTGIWSEFKARHGWQMHSLDDRHILERAMPLGQHFLYAPEISLPSSNLKKIVQDMRALGRETRAFAIRLEFLAEYSEAAAKRLTALGLKKAFEEVQPEWRQWIDLTLTETDILNQMKPKGRYNIRLAERHGVRVTESRDIGPFYDLIAETAARDGFAIRSQAYYADLLDTLQKNNLGALYIANSPKTQDSAASPLAAAIISWHDGVASYLYGASSNTERELMAPYALHWHIIQEAKKRSCKVYDLLAVSPPDDIQLPASSLQLREKYRGISRFKSQFGGRTVHLLGSWDLVLKPIVYQVFKFMEVRRRH